MITTILIGVLVVHDHSRQSDGDIDRLMRDAAKNARAIAVKVIDPVTESMVAISPAEFDARTAAQAPLVISDVPRVRRIAALLETLSCADPIEGADLRYRWDFAAADGRSVSVYASASGKIYAADAYWACSDDTWVAEAWTIVGGPRNRAPIQTHGSERRSGSVAERGDSSLWRFGAAMAAVTLLSGLLRLLWRRRYAK